nr:hypothetical protein [Schwartzia sp. (in: firmicutes)]
MKTATTSFLPVLATMLLSVCITPSARADRAENAFVVVEGDGVVRLDGKNFAVLSSGKGESLVKVTAQPGWKLESPSSAKVSAAKPLRYKATDASHEGSATGQLSGLTATFITPAGDPVNTPVDSDEGQNEFTFSTASIGTLTIDLTVKIDPVLSNDQAPEGDFSINGIGNSAKQWAAANPNGRAIFSGGYYRATVTFNGLPANNSDFGRKTVTFSVADVTINQVFEVFYPAHAYNHPNDGGQHSFYGEPVPNWFFYYKQNAGKDIKYCEERSHSESGKGIETIELGPDAYCGNDFIETTIENDRLAAVGISEVNCKYYANFCGVLEHECQHATNEGGWPDSDRDHLSDSFETGTSKTDPNDKFSAWNNGGAVISSHEDNEIYAGGVIEQQAIESADTSNDWANPGTNSI